MHVFIVYCHPSPVSFTCSLLQMFIRGVKEAGHTYEVSDLYGMDFRPDMNEYEYFRESGRDLARPVPDDVKLEQEKIGRADALAFIYPVWWSDCPAKLKGWFDRVYTQGYAYSMENRENTTFLNFAKIKRALVICSAGHPLDHLEDIGIAESMRRVMLTDRLTGIGVKNAQVFILGGTVAKDPGLEAKYLETVFQLGKAIGDRY